MADFVKRVAPVAGAISPAFQRELAVLEAVRHRGLARLVSASTEPDGTGVVVTERIDGPSLRTALDAGPRIAPGIFDALEALHAAGFVHGDLKPENVVLGPAGPVLVDFGLAVRIGARWHADGAGTPAYMAPEQVRREVVDARTDHYALGLVLYELLAGQPAFVGDTEAQLRHRQLTSTPAPPHVANFDAPEFLSDFTMLLLAKDPAKRPAADEIRAALARAAAAS